MSPPSPPPAPAEAAPPGPERTVQSPPGPAAAGSPVLRAPGASALGRLLDTDGLAALLGMERSGALALCRRGHVPALKIAGRWYCREVALLKRFEAREAEARAASPEARLARIRALLPPRRRAPAGR